jgi:DNA transposase THAP9
MLKMMRKCFACYGILKDRQGRKINWKYIEKLHKLQEVEGLRLGIKLKTARMM